MAKAKEPKAVKEKKKMGRPSDYTEELALKICEAVATSTKSLGDICKEHDDFPDVSNVNKWRLRHDEFRVKFAEAKRLQAELLAESLDELAAEKSTYIDSEGNVRVDSGFTAAKRLQVDTRKWIASKLLPKVYGDRPQDDVKTAADTLIEKLLEKL